MKFKFKIYFRADTHPEEAAAKTAEADENEEEGEHNP